MPAFDIYMYYQPNMLYALQRLTAGGSGLLWNPWQNCGQPSFGISSTGLLYPANAIYLLVDPDLALRLVSVFNVAVAGLGAYGLCRTLGTGRAAALCGALAFELGSATLDLNTWGPQMGGTYVWLPVSMLFCERLLRKPCYGSAVGLGVSLALPLLIGFPQIVFFAYQIIALRVVFELATRRAAWSLHCLAWLALGLALAPLLTAAHLLPGIEMATRSVRGLALTLKEIQPNGTFLTWERLGQHLTARGDTFNPFLIVPTAAAAAWWCRRATCRVGIFYVLAGVLYLCLALGPETPLFDFYRTLPMGSLFREPARFTWMTSFCMAVLSGLGVDALLTPVGGWRRLAAPASITAALVGLNAATQGGLLPIEYVLGGALAASALAVAVSPRSRALAAAVSIAAVGLGLGLFQGLLPSAPAGGPGRSLAVRHLTIRRLIDGDILTRQAELLQRSAAQMSPQDRAFFDYQHYDFSFMLKSASLFSLPSLQDYEPQAALHYGDYYIFLRTGAPLRDLNQFYFPLLVGQRLQRSLLDLAAARYVVADAGADPRADFGMPPLYPLDVSDDLDLTLYENQQALPRARWVPSAIVVPPSTQLHRLAQGRDNPRAVLLLEEVPASGFLGQHVSADQRREASVEFELDEPEHLRLRVRAPTAGFLHLADQHFPGWQATVNDAPATILRANYLFRAVEIPAGESTVEFRYSPASLRVGAAVSGATILALVVAGVFRRRRFRAV